VQPDLEVEHVKRYTMASLLRTDFRRAASLVRLKLRHRAELGRNNSSVPTGYIASIPLVGAAVAALPLGVLSGQPPLVAAGLFLTGLIALLNREFPRTIRVHGGPGRALASVFLLWLELLVAGVGAGFGLLGFAFGNRY
jgi:hypothetical protein